MRKSLVLATLVVLVCSAAAFAGVPDPTRSGCALNAQPLACQWRFRNDGNLDKLTLKVTLRDSFDAPVAGCSTACNLGGASLIAKSCGGDRKVVTTTAGGVANFVYRCIGGRGTVQLRVTSLCGTGVIGICTKTITFNNPDLSGSRDTDNGACNVIDLGIWSGGLPPAPYALASDFDCNGAVNVIDLGIFAGGLTVNCTACP